MSAKFCRLAKIREIFAVQQAATTRRANRDLKFEKKGYVTISFFLPITCKVMNIFPKINWVTTYGESRAGSLFPLEPYVPYLLYAYL